MKAACPQFAACAWTAYITFYSRTRRTDVSVPRTFCLFMYFICIACILLSAANGVINDDDKCFQSNPFPRTRSSAVAERPRNASASLYVRGYSKWHRSRACANSSTVTTCLSFSVELWRDRELCVKGHSRPLEPGAIRKLQYDLLIRIENRTQAFKWLPILKATTAVSLAVSTQYTRRMAQQVRAQRPPLVIDISAFGVFYSNFALYKCHVGWPTRYAPARL